MMPIDAHAVGCLTDMVPFPAADVHQTSETPGEAAPDRGDPPAMATIKVAMPPVTANLVADGRFTFAMIEFPDSPIPPLQQAFHAHAKTMAFPNAVIVGMSRKTGTIARD